MPTQTFFNLPAEKQERILKAAQTEFSQYPFSKASIARIIDAAGIPRGSFYQYFADLKDIYMYIFQQIGKVKSKYVMRHMSPDADTFTTIRQLYRSGMQFAADYPEYAAIGNLFFKEDIVVKREIYGEQVGKADNFFVDLLKQGQAAGEIDPQIDLQVASEVFFYLNIALIDNYLASRKGNIFEDGEEYLGMLDKMLYIIENGMRKR